MDNSKKCIITKIFDIEREVEEILSVGSVEENVKRIIKISESGREFEKILTVGSVEENVKRIINEEGGIPIVNNVLYTYDNDGIVIYLIKEI